MYVSCMNRMLVELQTFYHLSQKAKIKKWSMVQHWVRLKIGEWFYTFSSICSISIDSESKTCSLRSGVVSADVLGIADVPILLYATSFISISFSSLRACFRRTVKKWNAFSIIHLQNKQQNQHFFIDSLPSHSDAPILIIFRSTISFSR